MMFDWGFKRIEGAAAWLAADLKRTHIAMLFLDCLVLIMCWIILSRVYLVIVHTEDLLTVPRGKDQWVLAGLCIPVLHYALTPWGQIWIKRSAKSFSIAILIITIGGAVLGIVITDYARTQAVLAGYRSCDLSLIEDFKRENETLVAPGVLCPPSSLHSTPYPPPE